MLETLDNLHPMNLTVCEANSSEGICTFMSHPAESITALREGSIGSLHPVQSPGALLRCWEPVPKQSQEMQRTCSSSRSSFVPDTAALQSRFPRYELSSHISVKESSFAWISFPCIMYQ